MIIIFDKIKTHLLDMNKNIPEIIIILTNSYNNTQLSITINSIEFLEVIKYY